jgi:sterol desaturase/sphingolipid hydroxylase (fatty acid hydroxylase superfamily)
MSRNMAPGKWGWFTPFAGGRDGAFFRIAPAYVDPQRAPGFSTKEVPNLTAMLLNGFTLRYFWASPYVIWLAIAAALHGAGFTYDLSPRGAAFASPCSAAFFRGRFPPLLATTLLYYSFFHGALYFWGWAARPFVHGRVYRWAKTLHNAALVVIGVGVWVAVENVVCHLWATGRLRFTPDAAMLASPGGLLGVYAVAALLPVWRASHFFIGHHFIHAPALYGAIHNVHHRNADPDVFAGLAMHPLEQLWFFAGAMPLLWLPVPPFAFFFLGICFLVSPAGGHSGWEDVVQSDIHHYLHHRCFEVNYASFDASALDAVFGTYMGSLADAGEKLEDPATGAPARLDARATLWGAPALKDVAFLAASAACLAPWVAACGGGGAGSAAAGPARAYALGVLAGAGPVALAYALPHGAVGAKSKGAAVDALMWFLGLASSALPVSLACAWCLL